MAGYGASLIGETMDFDLTNKERAAISALKRVAKIWPDTLWIFCNGLSVNIMRKNEDGEQAHNQFGSVDSEYIVDTVDIENDGGDW